jgi:hypothetical protein
MEERNGAIELRGYAPRARHGEVDATEALRINALRCRRGNIQRE